LCRVIAKVSSQNGRFLCHLSSIKVFNADEEGRIAIDGILSHVAGAGRGKFQPPASLNLLAMRSRPLPSFSQPMSSRSPTNPKPILLPVKKAVSSIVPLPKKFSPRSSSRTLLTNTAGRVGRLAPFTPLPTQPKDAEHQSLVRIYFFTGLQHYSVLFPPERGTGAGAEPVSADTASGSLFSGAP